MKLNDWAAVEAEISRIIASEKKGPYTSDTIAQVTDFLKAIRDRCPVPEVGKGWYSTIRFTWIEDPSLEIEVFSRRLEVYRFYDGRTEIRYVDHTPGEPYPPDLMAELPPLP